ncbi:MAG: hypothetical protein JSR46_02695 [Verrucomicrobia bacterium]|nr:hypothetical protein [Verrucomicrobiota bacterium]
MNTDLSLDSSSKFFCHDDIAPPSPDQLRNDIYAIEESLNSIATEQKTIALSLQSRNVSLQWDSDISDLSGRLNSCLASIQELSRYLPFLDEKHAADGFQKFITFELNGYLLNKINKKLLLLIKSPEHRETVELYKKVIAECEKSSSPSFTLLSGLITEVEEKIETQKKTLAYAKPYLQKSIRVIHQDTVRFLHYATNITELQERLERLAKEINPIEQSLANSENDALPTCSNIALPYERCFRQGASLSSFWYSTIFPIVQVMENVVAKCLYKKEADLEKQIKKDWQWTSYSLQPDMTCLENLTGYLSDLKEQLYDVDFYYSNQVHEGLFYAASLSAWIDDLQNQMAFLSKVNTPQWQRVRRVQQSFYKLLQKLPRETSNYQIIYDLYAIIKELPAIQEAKALSGYKERMIAVLTKTLTNYAGAIFCLSPYEMGLENMVRLRFDGSIDLPELKCLIAKKIVRCLYFTDNSFDLSLDLLLVRLESLEKYAEGFTNIVHDDLILQELISRYKKMTGLERDAQTLRLFDDLLQLIKQISRDPDQHGLLGFFTSCQIMQRVSEIKRAGIYQERKNLLLTLMKKNSFESQASSVYQDSVEVGGRCKSDVTNNQNILFTLLVRALWATDSAEQAEAQEAILRADLSSTKLNQDLRRLLKELALRRFLTQVPLGALEEAYLPSLFADYIVQPSTWSMVHGILTMEEALFTFLKREDTSHIASHQIVTAARKKFRSSELFTKTWAEIMEEHFILKEHKKNNAFQDNIELAIEWMQYHNSFVKLCKDLQRNEHNYARPIFEGLLQGMEGILTAVSGHKTG